MAKRHAEGLLDVFRYEKKALPSDELAAVAGSADAPPNAKRAASAGKRARAAGSTPGAEMRQSSHALDNPGGATAGSAEADAGSPLVPAARSCDPALRTLSAAEESAWIDKLLQRTEVSVAVRTSAAAVKAVLDVMADNLLCHTALVIEGVAYTFLEIEAYLTTDSSVHSDGFVHGDPRQRLFGRWYFHRAGSSYKGGTYKVCTQCYVNMSISTRTPLSRLRCIVITPLRFLERTGMEPTRVSVSSVLRTLKDM